MNFCSVGLTAREGVVPHWGPVESLILNLSFVFLAAALVVLLSLLRLQPEVSTLESCLTAG